jgi:hypothetical protein
MPDKCSSLYSAGGGYVNFGAWFMKNLSITQTETHTIMKKGHFLENKT